MTTCPGFRRHGDVLVLRTAVLPLRARPDDWPDVESPASCRAWLTRVWSDDAFVVPLRAASPRLVGFVERILNGDEVPQKRVRSATLSVAGYLLRASDRATPFGLFAGVTLAGVGPVSATFGTGHRAVARPDTLWVDHVRRTLLRRTDVLPHLTIQVSTLSFRRGDAVCAPRPGGRLASAPVTRPLAVLLRTALAPASGRHLLDALIEAGGTPEQAARLIGQALEDGYLTSDLTVPMTDEDPARHIVSILRPHVDALEPDTVRIIDRLGETGRVLALHNRAEAEVAPALRAVAEKGMREIEPADCRSRISLDLCVDAQVTVEHQVLDEVERAVHTLLRLTRAQGESPAWAAYQTHFWERYGAGVLVPVQDAADLAAGIGLPADYPLSVWSEAPPRVLPRDERLAARAMQAAMTGDREIVLTEQDIDDLADTDTESLTAPHVEIGFRIRAVDREAVRSGDFTLDVRPAWTAGVLSGRFASVLGHRAVGPVPDAAHHDPRGLVRAALLRTRLPARPERLPHPRSVAPRHPLGRDPGGGGRPHPHRRPRRVLHRRAAAPGQHGPAARRGAARPPPARPGEAGPSAGPVPGPTGAWLRDGVDRVRLGSGRLCSPLSAAGPPSPHRAGPGTVEAVRRGPADRPVRAGPAQGTGRLGGHLALPRPGATAGRRPRHERGPDRAPSRAPHPPAPSPHPARGAHRGRGRRGTRLVGPRPRDHRPTGHDPPAGAAPGPDPCPRGEEPGPGAPRRHRAAVDSGEGVHPSHRHGPDPDAVAAPPARRTRDLPGVVRAVQVSAGDRPSTDPRAHRRAGRPRGRPAPARSVRLDEAARRGPSRLAARPRRLPARDRPLRHRGRDGRGRGRVRRRQPRGSLRSHRRARPGEGGGLCPEHGRHGGGVPRHRRGPGLDGAYFGSDSGARHGRPRRHTASGRPGDDPPASERDAPPRPGRRPAAGRPGGVPVADRRGTSGADPGVPAPHAPQPADRARPGQ